jgi:YD repeat-containing protein
MSAILDPVQYTNKVNVEVKPAHVYEEHTNSLETIKFSPFEPQKFATGSHDHSIKLWDVEKSKSLSTLKVHDKGVWSLDWHPQGKLIASTSPDGHIVVTDLISGKTMHKSKANFEIGYSIEFSKKGDLMASGGLNGKLELYDTASWKLSAAADFPDSIVYSAKFHDNDSKVVSCDSNGNISIFNSSLNREYSKNLTKSEIRAFDFVGNSIVTSFETGNIKIFDYNLSAGLSLVHDLKGHTDQVNAIHHDAKTGFLFSGSKDCSIFAWRGVEYQFVHTLVGHIDQIAALDTNCNNTLLGSASWDQTARVYRISDIEKTH